MQVVYKQRTTIQTLADNKDIVSDFTKKVETTMSTIE